MAHLSLVMTMPVPKIGGFLANSHEIECESGQLVNLLDHFPAGPRLSCFICDCPDGFVRCVELPDCLKRQQQQQQVGWTQKLNKQSAQARLASLKLSRSKPSSNVIKVGSTTYDLSESRLSETDSQFTNSLPASVAETFGIDMENLAQKHKLVARRRQGIGHIKSTITTTTIEPLLIFTTTTIEPELDYTTVESQEPIDTMPSTTTLASNIAPKPEPTDEQRHGKHPIDGDFQYGDTIPSDASMSLIENNSDSHLFVGTKISEETSLESQSKEFPKLRNQSDVSANRGEEIYDAFFKLALSTQFLLFGLIFAMVFFIKYRSFKQTIK